MHGSSSAGHRKPSGKFGWQCGSIRVTLAIICFGWAWLSSAMENYDDAAKTLKQAAKGNPDDERNRIVLAASYGHLGHTVEAQGAIETANRLRLEDCSA